MIRILSMYKNTNTYINININMNICMHACMYIHPSIHPYIHPSIHLYIHTYIYLFNCIYTHIYIYIYIIYVSGMVIRLELDEMMRCFTDLENAPMATLPAGLGRSSKSQDTAAGGRAAGRLVPRWVTLW